MPYSLKYDKKLNLKLNSLDQTLMAQVFVVPYTRFVFIT